MPAYIEQIGDNTATTAVPGRQHNAGLIDDVLEELQLGSVKTEYTGLCDDQGYINTSGVNAGEGDSTWLRCDEFIPVVAGDVINISVAGSSGISVVAYYDSSKQFVSKISGDGPTYPECVVEGDYTVPAGVEFVRFSFGNIATWSQAMLHGKMEVFITAQNSTTRIKAIENTLTDNGITSDGKVNIEDNICLFGDSITADADWWTKYLLEYVNFGGFYNYARSGATWSHLAGTVYNITDTGGVTDANNVIWNQINKFIADNNANIPDVFYILAGTNDYSRPVGDPSTVFDGVAMNPDPATHTTLSSAFRFCIDLLASTFPEARIIVSTPITRAIANDIVTPVVAETIKECAGHCGAYVVDQYSDSGIYGYQESLTHTKISVDNVHPSDPLGHQLLGRFNANEIVSLLGVS